MGQCFVLTETEDVDLPSLHVVLLLKLPRVDYRMPVHHDGVPRSIASDQGTPVRANEMWQWAHGLTMFSTIAKQLV